MHSKLGIVENEESFRTTLANELYSFHEIFIWNSAEDCLADAVLGNCDILLVDIGLPDMSGVELIKVVKNRHPNIKILVVSKIFSDDIIFQALQFGANGYIWKNELKNIKSMVEDILNDGSAMSPSIGIRLLHFFRSRVSPNQDEILSDRERQVMEVVISGMKISQIAVTMDISEGTVRKHINNIYTKLHVSNRVELMKKASTMGYL